MTFEEFFKKKKIDLMALQSGQPGLFSEFKEHYEAMGEKSFDHTKKYWFNKLRLQYRLAAEIKEEKVIIENRLAEQTIVESLTEPATANVGFKPRFKAGATAAKPAPEPVVKAEESKEATASADTETSAAAKPAGFKPRFNAKAIAPKTDEPVAQDKPATEASAEAAAPKPAGFKPRFNAAKMAAPKTEEQPAKRNLIDETPSEIAKLTETSEEAPAAPKPAGFKPRFNAAKMAPKKDEPVVEEKAVEQTPTEVVAPTEATAAPKPAGFKPRFNAAKMAPKKEEHAAEDKPSEETTAESAAPAEQKAEDIEAEEQETKPAAETTAKLGFKPRFNPKTTKPQPPKTED